MGTIKPITLEIEESLWTNYKKVMTKDKSINEHIIDLIKKYVEDKK